MRDDRSWLDVLWERVEDLKDELELDRLHQQIIAHPLPAVAIACACGAIAGLGAPRVTTPDERRTLGTLVTTAIATLLVRGAKAYAWSRLSSAARGAIDPSRRQQPAARAADDTFYDH